jgi:hypothetical protein
MARRRLPVPHRPRRERAGDALRTIEAIAVVNGAEHTPYVRIGAGDDVYLDPAHSQWCAVRITAVRWEIVDHVPCKFLRPPAMAPLPEPEMGGSEAELHSFARLVDDEFMLAVGWPAGTLNPRGRLSLSRALRRGRQRQDKPRRAVRSIIDPSLAPDRGRRATSAAYA